MMFSAQTRNWICSPCGNTSCFGSSVKYFRLVLQMVTNEFSDPEKTAELKCKYCWTTIADYVMRDSRQKSLEHLQEINKSHISFNFFTLAAYLQDTPIKHDRFFREFHTVLHGKFVVNARSSLYKQHCLGGRRG